MSSIQRHLSIFVSKITPVKITFALFLLSMVLFVLVAGAPESGGTLFR